VEGPTDRNRRRRANLRARPLEPGLQVGAETDAVLNSGLYLPVVRMEVDRLTRICDMPQAFVFRSPFVAFLAGACFLVDPGRDTKDNKDGAVSIWNSDRLGDFLSGKALTDPLRRSVVDPVRARGRPALPSPRRHRVATDAECIRTGQTLSTHGAPPR
jgi:hypothetical protein